MMLVVGGCLTLTACGGGPSDTAAKACAAEVANRLTGKTYEVSTKDFASSAQKESADTFLLKTPVTFDKGLATEYKQLCQCRVRVDQSGAATVLFMEFEWDNADIKKSQ
jgi:hypothetical protein